MGLVALTTRRELTDFKLARRPGGLGKKCGHELLNHTGYRNQIDVLNINCRQEFGFESQFLKFNADHRKLLPQCLRRLEMRTSLQQSSELDITPCPSSPVMPEWTYTKKASGSLRILASRLNDIEKFLGHQIHSLRIEPDKTPAQHEELVHKQSNWEN